MNPTDLDSMLKCLPADESGKGEGSLRKETVLELKVDEAVVITDAENSELPPIKYLPLDEFLPEFIYATNSENANLYNVFPSLEDEAPAPTKVDEKHDSSPAADEEAREKLQELKYDALVAPTETNYEERKKLALWIMFHPAEFCFLESVYGLNRNADYRFAV